MGDWALGTRVRISAVELSPADGSPANGYELQQNYPNPFNPVTTISFKLSQPQFVSLKVYDVRGREIAILAEGKFADGHHRISFHAHSLAAGVYLVKLQAGGQSKARRMILVK